MVVCVGPACGKGYCPVVLVVWEVVVLLLLGATGDRGEEVVLSSDVVVVVELGMLLSSLAQPASVSTPAAAIEERIRFLITIIVWGKRGAVQAPLLRDWWWWSSWSA